MTSGHAIIISNPPFRDESAFKNPNKFTGLVKALLMQGLKSLAAILYLQTKTESYNLYRYLLGVFGYLIQFLSLPVIWWMISQKNIGSYKLLIKVTYP